MIIHCIRLVSYLNVQTQSVMSLIDKASGALGTTPLGLGLGAVSLAGQVFGAIKGAQEAKKNEEIINKEIEKNQADYDLNANRSFLETNAAKDVMKVNKENLVDERKAVAGRAAITGSSDEAVTAANTGVNKNYNDSVSRLAGMGTQYQDRRKQMYMNNRSRLFGQKMAVNAQKAEGASNLVANAGDLFGTLAFTSGMDGKKVQARSDNSPLMEIPKIAAKKVTLNP